MIEKSNTRFNCFDLRNESNFRKNYATKQSKCNKIRTIFRRFIRTYKSRDIKRNQITRFATHNSSKIFFEIMKNAIKFVTHEQLFKQFVVLKMIMIKTNKLKQKKSSNYIANSKKNERKNHDSHDRVSHKKSKISYAKRNNKTTINSSTSNRKFARNRQNRNDVKKVFFSQIQC